MIDGESEVVRPQLVVARHTSQQIDIRHRAQSRGIPSS
jgi:hypothetical protein